MCEVPHTIIPKFRIQPSGECRKYNYKNFCSLHFRHTSFAYLASILVGLKERRSSVKFAPSLFE